LSDRRRPSRRRLVGVALTLMLAVSAIVPVTATATVPGCTPGFWKTHTGPPWSPGNQANAWVGASPTALFDNTAGPNGVTFADAFPGQTLLEVLQLQGGGLNALGRHAVAAFLNAKALGDWTLSANAVVTRFNAAFASGSYEDQKDQFEGYNSFGTCPLP
jgi:hypothetical protein